MTVTKVRDITAAHLGQMVQVNGYLGRVQSMSIAEDIRFVELHLVDEDGEEWAKTWVRLDEYEAYWRLAVAAWEAEAGVHSLYDQARTLKRAQAIVNKIPDAFHCLEFPTKALTVDGLAAQVEKFGGCDLVFIDYGQLLKPSAQRGDRRHEITDVYEGLRRTAGELKLPIWTAHQANRLGYGIKTIDIGHVSEDFNVAAISDIALSLNQSDEERKHRRLRLYIAGSRIGPSNEQIDCTVDWWTSTIKEVNDEEVLGK
mgnify:CR=1 FL=1